jgi:hypothetical protein
MHGGEGKDGWCTGVNVHDCECEVVGEDNGVGEGDRADGDGLGPPVQG